MLPEGIALGFELDSGPASLSLGPVVGCRPSIGRRWRGGRRWALRNFNGYGILGLGLGLGLVLALSFNILIRSLNARRLSAAGGAGIAGGTSEC